MRPLHLTLLECLQTEINTFHASLKSAEWIESITLDDKIVSIFEYRVSASLRLADSNRAILDVLTKFANERPWIECITKEFIKAPYYHDSLMLIIKITSHRMPEHALAVRNNLHDMAEMSYDVFDCGTVKVKIDLDDILHYNEYIDQCGNEGPETCLISYAKEVESLTKLGYTQDAKRVNRYVSPPYAVLIDKVATNNG